MRVALEAVFRDRASTCSLSGLLFQIPFLLQYSDDSKFSSSSSPSNTHDESKKQRELQTGSTKIDPVVLVSAPSSKLLV